MPDPGFFSVGVQADGQKTVWTTFLGFFSPQLNLQRGPMVILQRKLYFSKDPERVQHFPGGGGGGGGVQLFPGGGGFKC